MGRPSRATSRITPNTAASIRSDSLNDRQNVRAETSTLSRGACLRSVSLTRCSVSVSLRVRVSIAVREVGPRRFDGLRGHAPPAVRGRGPRPARIGSVHEFSACGRAFRLARPYDSFEPASGAFRHAAEQKGRSSVYRRGGAGSSRYRRNRSYRSTGVSQRPGPAQGTSGEGPTEEAGNCWRRGGAVSTEAGAGTCVVA